MLCVLIKLILDLLYSLDLLFWISGSQFGLRDCIIFAVLFLLSLIVVLILALLTI